MDDIIEAANETQLMQESKTNMDPNIPLIHVDIDDTEDATISSQQSNCDNLPLT